MEEFLQKQKEDMDQEVQRLVALQLEQVRLAAQEKMQASKTGDFAKETISSRQRAANKKNLFSSTEMAAKQSPGGPSRLQYLASPKKMPFASRPDL